jgi:hypothetical protein
MGMLLSAGISQRQAHSKGMLHALHLQLQRCACTSFFVIKKLSWSNLH